VEELGEDRTQAFAADVGDEAAVDQLYQQVLDWRPQLDGIVVNAGIWITEDVPVHRMELTQWERTMRDDLTSTFLTCRGFLRHLASAPRERASIVMISSTAGLFGEENHADYSAAKAAMAHGLTASLKNEIVRLAPRGRVNCVCPGWVLTPMAAAALAGPEDIAAATHTVAMRKVARPEEIARSVVFLSSAELAGHITGSVLPVTGGMEGRLLHP
jgi:3-oxoacyl-[acyl-carrier protein] reductase